MPLEQPHAHELNRLIELRRNGAMLPGKFCTKVMAGASTANAADLLEHLPEEERSEFEWWFAMQNGTSFMPSAKTMAAPSTPQDALHQAIIARRLM